MTRHAPRTTRNESPLRLAVDLRELRRHHTGIGRWTRNFLAVRDALAPRVEIVGVGHHHDIATASVIGPRGPWCGLTLNAMIRRERIGLWLSPYFKIPPGLACPAIATVHDTIPATIPHRRLPFVLRLKLTLRQAWRIATVSETSRHDLIRNWSVAPERIILATNCVSRIFSPTILASDQFVLDRWNLRSKDFFLVVSDDRPHKNLATLLRALAGCARPVVIVGTRRTDLLEPFLPIPYADDAILSVLYRHALRLLHPALAEGFGLPALEAMASGTPCILARIPSLIEIGGRTAHYVDPMDEAAWRAAVESPPTATNVVEQAALFAGERTSAALWQAIESQCLRPNDRAE